MRFPNLSRGVIDVSIVTFLVVILLGPRVKVDERIHPVDVPEEVEAWIADSEAAVPGIRPGDEKSIVWFDSVGVRTPLSVVYLHGFGADRHEIDPVPQQLAHALGANLFLTRLVGHGQDGSAMAGVAPLDWFQDVAEAIEVGTAIGDRVVLLGTSTGGTLGTWAAAHPDLKQDLAALILVSPNFHPRDHTSRLLLWPWGRYLLKVLVGRERCWEPANEAQGRHWTTCYPSEALLSMMGLVERVRTMDLGVVSAPTLAIYSPDDEVVDADATVAGFARLGAVPKVLKTFDSGEDRSHHLLAGDIMAPGANEAIVDLMTSFLAEARVR